MKQQKILNTNKGITLIAVVITIIILLILAGTSLQMILENDELINKAGEVVNKTKEMQKYEELEIAVLRSYISSANLDIDKLLKKLNKIENIIVMPTDENGVNTFPIIVKTDYNNYEIISNGNINEIIIADRTGISTGDYIKYTSPTTSVTFSESDTGYSAYASTPVTLTAKDTFRVLEIDKYGNVTLIGAMSPSDPTIYFSGAKGYNNAVYTLNTKCSELYQDLSRGITARSIKIEDIIEKMIEGTLGTTSNTSTGRKRIEKYQSETVAALKTGKYLTNKDTINNKLTFQINTYYPDIFQYETGGLIENVPTLGLIEQSEPYSEYKGLTDLGTTITSNNLPESLVAPYTYFSFAPNESDFNNTTENAKNLKNIFFETDAKYWLASRCIDCETDRIYFRIRDVNKTNIGGYIMYTSKNEDWNRSRAICPIIFIPASVGITVSTDKSMPHIVQ